MNPRWPIYIPTKGRWDNQKTMKALDAMRVPWTAIVEEQELGRYKQALPGGNFLVLDKLHMESYDACVKLPAGASKGSGPARNFAWDHAARSGAEWHWVMDDNLAGFLRMNRNQKVWVGDGTVLRCMEDFAARFSNVSMAGPHYEFFVLRKERRPPFVTNSRVYSCCLIRTGVPFRWRCRYNEDTDLSLRMLKAGWCTILFNAFLTKKITTQKMRGGNTDELYAGGTLEKSKMLVELHPDVVKLVPKWGRWHHHVDYGQFNHGLILDPQAKVRTGVDEHGMQLINVGNVQYGQDWRKQ